MAELSGNPHRSRRIDWTAIFAGTILVVAILTMLVPMVFGIEILGISGRAGVEKLLASFASSPLAQIEVVGAVALLCLTGFPVFLLIGAAAAIFGSVEGFIDSWIGLMLGASAGFWIGRISGGSLVRRYGGKTVHRASEILGRRGIFASAIVRIVPSGPAIMINMIAGASHMRFWQFVIGTGLGSIPKTALIAFVGEHFFSFLRERDWKEIAIAVAVLVGWFLLGMWIRRRFLGVKRLKPVGPSPGPASSGAPGNGLDQGSVH